MHANTDRCVEPAELPVENSSPLLQRLARHLHMRKAEERRHENMSKKLTANEANRRPNVCRHSTREDRGQQDRGQQDARQAPRILQTHVSVYDEVDHCGRVIVAQRLPPATQRAPAQPRGGAWEPGSEGEQTSR
jgi:hypothetical protein